MPNLTLIERVLLAIEMDLNIMAVAALHSPYLSEESRNNFWGIHQATRAALLGEQEEAPDETTKENAVE